MYLHLYIYSMYLYSYSMYLYLYIYSMYLYLYNYSKERIRSMCTWHIIHGKKLVGSVLAACKESISVNATLRKETIG